MVNHRDLRNLSCTNLSNPQVTIVSLEELRNLKSYQPARHHSKFSASQGPSPTIWGSTGICRRQVEELCDCCKHLLSCPYASVSDRCKRESVSPHMCSQLRAPRFLRRRALPGAGLRLQKPRSILTRPGGSGRFLETGSAGSMLTVQGSRRLALRFALTQRSLPTAMAAKAKTMDAGLSTMRMG